MEEEIYKDNWEKGVYKCSKCGHSLFKSDDKFDSGTRWPSFRKSMKEVQGAKTRRRAQNWLYKKSA